MNELIKRILNELNIDSKNGLASEENWIHCQPISTYFIPKQKIKLV